MRASLRNLERHHLNGAATNVELAPPGKMIAHGMKEYTDTGQAFINPNQAGVPVFGTLLRISVAKPSPETVADAWSRIEKSFVKHLK